MTDNQRREQAGLRPVLILAVPVFVESILRTLLGNVDQWMLSDFSSRAVAAVGNANQIMNMGFVALEMIGTATTIILAQYLGAGRKREARRLYTLSLSVILLFSLVLTGVLMLLHQTIFRWMNLPAELIPDATTYLAIVGGSIIAQGLFMGMSAILRSHMLMPQIMVVSVIMNIVNAAANFMLINGYFFFPRLGVVGAAMATVISRVVGMLLLGWLMIRELDVHITKEDIMHPDGTGLRQLFRVGLPAAGDSISYNCMQIVLLSLINTFGTVAVTAKVYVSTLLPMMYVFASALATATSIRVGYFVGAHEPHKAKQLVQKSTLLAVAVSFGLTLLLYFASDQVFGLFTRDPAILAMIHRVILVDVFLEIGRAINMMMIRSLLSAGDTAYPLYCALVSMWGVGVALGFLLGRGLGFGLVGVWFGLAADEWCRAIAFLLRWKSGRWQKKRLV